MAATVGGPHLMQLCAFQGCLAGRGDAFELLFHDFCLSLHALALEPVISAEIADGRTGIIHLAKPEGSKNQGGWPALGALAK